jgi:hypothetical protein
VFAAYDGHAVEVGFTLSVYAPAAAKIAWDESVPTPPFTSKVSIYQDFNILDFIHCVPDLINGGLGRGGTDEQERGWEQHTPNLHG